MVLASLKQEVALIGGLGAVMIGYLLIVGGTWALQEKLLYHPDPHFPSTAMVSAKGLRMWPGQARGEYRGFISAQGRPKANGTVVVFHGNAGSASDRGYYIAALEPRGLRVVLAEYPAFGGRPGELGEGPFVSDGHGTVKRALEQWGEPIYLWGESLGAAVAAAIAADAFLPVAGVVLLTPWDTLPDLAQAIYWFLPARWLTRDRYDSIANLAQYGGRVAILVAEKDEVVPRRHGLRLFESIRGPKKFWEFPNATHNTWPAGPQERWWGEVLAFLEGPSMPWPSERKSLW